ncbi:MAG TPA: DUF2240 family protein [Candidatus Poseidoniales archaeon]|nr:DUF2240 family protein [Candidatus Poseidoniales archaeon]
MESGAEQAPDIAILLAQTWRARPGQTIDSEAICRIWAYDLGWFDMRTAARVRDGLIDSGWLEMESGGLSPTVDISSVELPFAWMPVMEDPPLLSGGKLAEPVEEVEEETAEMSVEPTPQPAAVDPATAHITVLLERISESSNLDRKEVMRRAQRKRRALGPVTLWMALLLVAREQRLSMPGLVRTISA